MRNGVPIGLIVATLVVIAFPPPAADAQSRTPRDMSRQWRAPTPYWELLRRERDAVVEESAPPAPEEKKPEVAPTPNPERRVQPFQPQREKSI
jgi:hypothetical protein